MNWLEILMDILTGLLLVILVFIIVRPTWLRHLW
jgi:hypothetical protein